MKHLFTIGHSNLNSDVFIGLLVKNGIECLVDIRSVPYSRFNPQFNRKRLEQTMLENGITYVFEGEALGGRIRDPECYVDGKIPERKTDMADAVDYEVLKTREWFIGGIERLVRLSETKRVAMMCSEEDPGKCHRSALVGRRLEELGFRLTHIRARQ